MYTCWQHVCLVHHSDVLFVLFCLVPEPTISISTIPGLDQAIYTGTTLQMTCSIVLSESVDTTVEVGIVWRKGGETVSTGGHSSVSDTMSVDETSYESTLTISPVDSTTDNGHYSCAVTVRPTPTSTFIVMATAEDTMTITVAGEFAWVQPHTLLEY